MLLQNLLKQERFLFLSMESNQLFSSYPHAFKSVVSDIWALNSFPTKIRHAEVLGVTARAGLPGLPTRLPQPAVPTSRLLVLHHQAENLARAGCRQGYRGCSAQSSAKTWATHGPVSRLRRQEPGVLAGAEARLPDPRPEAGCPGEAGAGCWSHQELQLLCRELLHPRTSEPKGQSNSKISAAMQRRTQRQCRSQGGSSCLDHLRGIYDQSEILYLKCLQEKGFLARKLQEKVQDRTTQAALFRRGTLL